MKAIPLLLATALTAFPLPCGDSYDVIPDSENQLLVSYESINNQEATKTKSQYGPINSSRIIIPFPTTNKLPNFAAYRRYANIKRLTPFGHCLPAGNGNLACDDVGPKPSARPLPKQSAPQLSVNASGDSLIISDSSHVEVPGAGLVNEPKRDWVYLNKDVFAHATTTSRTLHATVNDTDVTITLHAVGFTWDWGDGTVTRTTQPGRAWPHADIRHRYTRRAQNVRIRLTTSWEGTWSAPGASGTVSGQITTTDVGAPFSVYARNPKLND